MHPRLAALFLLALLTATPGLARDRQPEPAAHEERGHSRRTYADPGAVIAAEIGFSQLAREKGQWTAFLEAAAPEAEMFVPQRVKAAEWLKGRANPPVAVTWQPHEVWSSCDGSYAVTRGAWQRPDGSGYFITVWQRQEKGGYKWLLEQGDSLIEPLAAPEMIAGQVGDCSKVDPASPPVEVGLAGDRKDGLSGDGTLSWTSVVDPQGARVFALRLWKDGAMREVLRVQSPAAPSGG